MSQLAMTLGHYVRRIPAALLLALFVAAVLVRATFAHGVDLLSSEPLPGAVLEEPPTRVQAWFSAELVNESLLQVFDSGGKEVDGGNGGLDPNDPYHTSMVVQLPPLAEDVYTVRWYAVRDDADATEGLFHFTVGEPAVALSDIALPAPLLADKDSGIPVLGTAAFLVALLVATLVWFRAREGKKRAQSTPTRVMEENV